MRCTGYLILYRRLRCLQCRMGEGSMESLQDIRFVQRLDNYRKALSKIKDVVLFRTAGELSELETEGLIQRFEYTYELAWKTLQDLLRYKGYADIAGPNITLRKALEDGLISDHDSWRQMALARNATTHTYNEEEAIAITQDIYRLYAPLLTELEGVLINEARKAEQEVRLNND